MYVVASWACYVTEEVFCVRITVTSQAQLATKYHNIHIAVSVVYDTF